MESKPEKKKIFTKILYGFSAIVFVLLMSIQIIGQITARNNFGVASYAGLQVLVVRTDSMEPTYPVGTTIFVKKVNDLSTIKASTTPEAMDGDVITFMLTGYNIPFTHRVIEILEQEDGTYDFKALGDNLNAETCLERYGGPCSIADYDYVKSENVLGRVTGQSVGYGKFHNIVAGNPIIIFVFAIIPLFFVFISSIFDLGRQLKTSDGPAEVEGFDDEFEYLKQQEKLRILIEMEKEKIRSELIEQIKEDENHE